MSTRVELGLLALIIALSAALRFFLLDTIPAGWHHDEALMGVMASQVYLDIDRPIFFSAFLGQEPLYIYLSAGAMALMGGDQGILPLRVVSALFGVATVAVAYYLGREMFDRRVGFIGAALLGFSFWQVMLSREGYRVITQPLLEGLAVYLLYSAIKQHSTWRYVAAGVAFAGVAYTYLGARLFPGVLVLFAVWWVLTHGWPSAAVRRGLALFIGAAVVVVAPLLFYFATHAGTFTARMNQVSIFQPGVVDQPPLEALFANMVKLLGTFTFYGEPLWRFNMSGRPIFIGVVALLFYVGAIVCIRRAIGKQPASMLILAWFAVMLFPSALSYDVGAYTPRSMGLLPVLYFLPAIGFVVIWDFVVKKASGKWLPFAQRAFPAIAVIILVIEGGITYRDYFHDWANSFGNAYENMEDAVATADFLNSEARPGQEIIMVSSEYCEHATVAHLAPTVHSYVRWFDGSQAIVFPENISSDSLYVFQYSAMPRNLNQYFPPEKKVEESFFANGATKIVAYRLTSTDQKGIVNGILADPAFKRAEETFGDEIGLVGYKFDRRVAQGDELTVTVLWRILKDQSAKTNERVFFAHLLDHERVMWSQVDFAKFNVRQWRAGDMVLNDYVLKVGNDVSPGKYSVNVGLYDLGTRERIPVQDDAAGRDSVQLDFVKVAAGSLNSVAPTASLGENLGKEIELQGFDLPGFMEQASPAVLDVNLCWLAKGSTDEDYTVFVQLLNSEGQLVAQSDSQPAGGRFPTSYWEPGEQVVDSHQLQLGETLPPGEYKLIAGMYLLSTGQRLNTEGGADYVQLTDINIGSGD